MLYKVLSPDSLHDQSSNDSGIDDCFQGSNRSPPAGEVPAIPSNCTQQGSHSGSPTVSELCKELKTTPEAANKTRADNQRNTESQKKYLGVRVRLPVRDLLRNYRKARGEEPKDFQEDVAWKLNNERRRVVRDSVHGHPCSAKRSKQMNVCPPKNFEDLLEDLVEVLEMDLKQGGLCPLQRQIEIDCPQRCYVDCPVSLRDLHSRNHHPFLQTDDPAFHYRLGYFYENNAAHLDLVSSHKLYSDLECESWYHSPGRLTVSAGASCGTIAGKDRPFSHYQCYSQKTKHQSHPRSPLLEVKKIGQAALNDTQSSKSSQGECNGPLDAAQQYLPESSALSFFQFQLRQIESSLIALSPEDVLSVDKHGNTLLHYAVIQGKRALAYGLACRMSDMNRIDTKDSRGQTALHLAAERNQHLMVNDLISLGAQINERDFLGKTPVHLCAENGFLQVLQAIEKTLKNGTDVDIDAKDNNYLTPLHYVVLAHIATVKEFENSETGSDMQRFLALRKEQLLDGMSCLLRMGSSLSIQDINGRSVIHFAEEENDTEVLNFLYDHVEKLKTIVHKEFGLYAIIDPMNQKDELLAMAPELPPCKNYKQTGNVPSPWELNKVSETIKELSSKGQREI